MKAPTHEQLSFILLDDNGVPVAETPSRQDVEMEFVKDHPVGGPASPPLATDD